MTRLDIAVAGAGLIGRTHIGLIQASDACRLCGIVDPAAGAAEIARGAGVPRYATLAALFAAQRPDGVIVATPNALHVQNGFDCIEAGVPVLIGDGKGSTGSPWQTFIHTRIWHMAEDSAWFRTGREMQAAGFVRERGDWIAPKRQLYAAERSCPAEVSALTRNQERYSPLYEAKMVHQFDHRWATYDNGDSRDTTETEKMDTDFEPTPRYWVPQCEVSERLAANKWTRDWLIGWRDITSAHVLRTVIFAFLSPLATPVL